MDFQALLSEVTFKAIRSSGSGGQHVNKVASKVELHFNILESIVLNDGQKQLLKTQLKSRLTKEGKLVLQSDETRSQHKNKDIVTQRFLIMVGRGLIKPKKRKKTKVPKSVIKKRLKSKRIQSERKTARRKPDLD